MGKALKELRRLTKIFVCPQNSLLKTDADVNYSTATSLMKNNRESDVVNFGIQTEALFRAKF
jgi:hypothetical protein